MVVINKIDRPDARIAEVKHEIEELFLQLASYLHTEVDLDIPFLYASSRGAVRLVDMRSRAICAHAATCASGGGRRRRGAWLGG